jgi:hypothetical protein
MLSRYPAGEKHLPVSGRGEGGAVWPEVESKHGGKRFIANWRPLEPLRPVFRHTDTDEEFTCACQESQNMNS